MKKTIILLVLLFLPLLGQSQGFKNILKPTTVSDLKVNDRGLNSAWFLKLDATLIGTATRLSFDEFDKFDGLQTEYLSRAGFAVSFAHFVEKNGEAINNYSINGLVLTATSGYANMALAVTVSAFNFDVGFGYDIIKDNSFKENIFFVTAIHIIFN
jgi:hypothetical protein